MLECSSSLEFVNVFEKEFLIMWRDTIWILHLYHVSWDFYHDVVTSRKLGIWLKKAATFNCNDFNANLVGQGPYARPNLDSQTDTVSVQQRWNYAQSWRVCAGSIHICDIYVKFMSYILARAMCVPVGDICDKLSVTGMLVSKRVTLAWSNCVTLYSVEFPDRIIRGGKNR